MRTASREGATGSNRDFASLLDDLFVAAETPGEAAPRPTIPFDYLAVADELHSGRITLSDTAVADEYRAAGRDVEAELAALLHAAGLGGAPAGQTVEQPAPDTLSIEPEAIASELGLHAAEPLDFGRLRRAFALKNHPDRVPSQFRERALLRMQVANGLIDEAKRRALSKTRR